MFDAKLILCEKSDAKSAITSSAVDFKQAKPTTGMNARPLFLVVQVPTALAGTSMTISLEESDNGSAFTPVWTTAAITPTQATAGAQLVFQLPVEHKRYLHIKTAPTSVTGGAVTAFLSDVFTKPQGYKIEGIEFLPGAA